MKTYLHRMLLAIASSFLLSCLEEAESPRPIPPIQPDASAYDPRPPIRMPGTGSGYGSGISGPTGPTGPSGPSGMMMVDPEADGGPSLRDDAEPLDALGEALGD